LWEQLQKDPGKQRRKTKTWKSATGKQNENTILLLHGRHFYSSHAVTLTASIGRMFLKCNYRSFQATEKHSTFKKQSNKQNRKKGHQHYPLSRLTSFVCFCAYMLSLEIIDNVPVTDNFISILTMTNGRKMTCQPSEKSLV